MNCSGLPISFPTWLPQFGFKIAAAAISSKRKSNHNDEDLISQLSDDILISIIAHLPTKEAVRTSILSNRWRNIYKFAPDVDLNCECLVGTSPCNQISFVIAVDRFLRLRSGSNIRSLNLTCNLMISYSDKYERFVYSLGRSLRIERLSLNSSASFNAFSFSCHLIIQMPSLTYLSLGCCSLRQMPPSFVLTSSTSLQVLRLVAVTVADGALECILANCLSLHSLSMDICKLPSKLMIRGPNLELKSLWVRGCRGIVEIELCASNLATVEFESLDMVNFRFDHVPKLESVYLDFENVNTMSYVSTNLVRVLPRMKSLIFGTKGDIYQVVNCTTMGINTFNNLRQLSLHLYSTNRVDLLLLAPFLQRCPLLQEFHLNTEFVEYIDGPHVRRPIPVTHPELKKVEITGHSGTKSEIEFALYIIKSAICLEEMQISRCPKSYRGCDRWMGRDMPHWSKQTLDMIHGQLRGQAISQNARLTIQHSPISLNPCSLFNIVNS